MPTAGPSAAPLLRSGARAGSIIVWIGGPITAGGGASTPANHMSSIASRDLGLTEKNYAAANATVSNGLITRCYAARDDTSYDHQSVAYVILTGGLEDPVSALPAVIYKARDAANECRKAFPAARIIWAAGPGSLAGMNDTQLADTTTIVSAILGQARAADALAVNLRTVLGTDTSMQSSGILPNDAGHEALAEAIVEAIEDELDEHQQELEAQQKSLKSAQDAIKKAQEQLAKIVGDQGDQVNTLKTLTESLQKTDEKIDTIQRTLWENQQKLDNRIDKLDERVQKLENGTSA